MASTSPASIRAAVDGSSVRRELGLEHELVFGAIGRIYELKNYPALVEAFAPVLGNVPDVRLVIAGPGDPSPARRRAVELGIGDRVILPGPRRDIPQVLAAFDAFVHPAVAESFGMTIVEAMAMEKPVLSTPVGIAPEVIKPRFNGLLTSDVSCDALEGGLCELLAVRPHWQEIGTAARSAVQPFTATQMAARYTELYNRWLPGDAS